MSIDQKALEAARAVYLTTASTNWTESGVEHTHVVNLRAAIEAYEAAKEQQPVSPVMSDLPPMKQAPREDVGCVTKITDLATEQQTEKADYSWIKMGVKGDHGTYDSVDQWRKAEGNRQTVSLAKCVKAIGPYMPLVKDYIIKKDGAHSCAHFEVILMPYHEIMKQYGNPIAKAVLDSLKAQGMEFDYVD